MDSEEFPAELAVELWGAFHKGIENTRTKNPRYVLNTAIGRFETIDESVSPNAFCVLTDNDEPLWCAMVENNGFPEVILTLNEDDKVTGIRAAGTSTGR